MTFFPHSYTSSRSLHCLPCFVLRLLLIKNDIKWHALRMTPLILPVWVGVIPALSLLQCVFSTGFLLKCIFVFAFSPSAYVYDNASGKTPKQPFPDFAALTNPVWILLLTKGNSQGLFKKNKNHESVSHPCSKPCRVWVGGMTQEGNTCLYCLELCLSGEAVQVAYGNKDYAVRLCVFGRELSSLGQRQSMRDHVPSQKQNYQARNAK